MTRYPFVRAALEDAEIPFFMTRKQGILIPLDLWKLYLTDEDDCLFLQGCILSQIPSILFLEDELLDCCNRANLESRFSFYMKQREIVVRYGFPASIPNDHLGQLVLECLTELLELLPSFSDELRRCIGSTT